MEPIKRNLFTDVSKVTVLDVMTALVLAGCLILLGMAYFDILTK